MISAQRLQPRENLEPIHERGVLRVSSLQPVETPSPDSPNHVRNRDVDGRQIALLRSAEYRTEDLLGSDFCPVTA